MCTFYCVSTLMNYFERIKLRRSNVIIYAYTCIITIVATNNKQLFNN